MTPLFRRSIQLGGDRVTITVFDDGSSTWRVRTNLGLGFENTISADELKHIAWIADAAVEQIGTTKKPAPDEKA